MAEETAGLMERNQVEGTVTCVLFRNEENGYTVLKLDCGERGELQHLSRHWPGKRCWAGG